MPRSFNFRVNAILGVNLLVLMLGCATQPPTKTFTSHDIDSLFSEKALKKPIEITEDTIIIDARKPFDYAVAHSPRAYNMQWSDFADVQGPFPGRLKGDLSQDVLRLSLIGVTPKSKVVVVGYGQQGHGEEGRLAWTLVYLGINNVQVSDMDSLGLRYSNLVAPPKPNAERWQPEIETSVLVSKKELLNVITSKQVERVHIIDARSHDEYFSKNKKLEYELPDLRAVNIEWKQFFTAQGRPNLKMRQQLQAIHIQPEDRVIVICDNGVRSAAVTFSLLSIGYRKAALFSGGYAELLDKRQR